MTYGFDVVPVWTDDESCVVVRVVLRTEARNTVVFASGGQSCRMERFDLLATCGLESQVKMCWVRLRLKANAQGRDFIWAAQLYTERAFRDDGHTERLKSLDEEGSTCRVVADTEDDVVEHDLRGQ